MTRPLREICRDIEPILIEVDRLGFLGPDQKALLAEFRTALADPTPNRLPDFRCPGTIETGDRLKPLAELNTAPWHGWRRWTKKIGKNADTVAWLNERVRVHFVKREDVFALLIRTEGLTEKAAWAVLAPLQQAIEAKIVSSGAGFAGFGVWWVFRKPSKTWKVWPQGKLNTLLDIPEPPPPAPDRAPKRRRGRTRAEWEEGYLEVGRPHGDTEDGLFKWIQEQKS